MTRGAAWLLAGGVASAACAGTIAAAASGPLPTGPAEIELRKSFRFIRRTGRQAERAEHRDNGRADPVPAGGLQPGALLEAVANALGERLHSSGALHLPGVGATETVLDGATTPVLETATGRHLIIDRGRIVSPGAIDQIRRLWPGYSVVQPPAGAALRDVLGSVLDAAGYDTVLRAAPLTFGRSVAVRFTPDFLVLRTDLDLLAGESRAISVVEPVDALPPELRELAGEHRVRVVELTPDGAPAGAARPLWRDPGGRVTTVETARLAPVVSEIALALGFSVEPRAPLPTAMAGPGSSADLRISRGGDSAYVFERATPAFPGGLLPVDEAVLVLKSPAELAGAIGALLNRFSVPAIGPVVEFYRAPRAGATQRFVVTVPGWLAETGGRRLLITGAALPLLVRLFLTREGIDIFEYRVAGR